MTDVVLFLIVGGMALALLIAFLALAFSPSHAAQVRELDECRALCAKADTDFVFDAENLHCTCCTRGLQVTVPTHH